MKIKHWWIFIGWLLLYTSVGCISTKSYVDPIYANANYEDIIKPEIPYMFGVSRKWTN